MSGVPNHKPRVFIGSSYEKKRFAYAIQANLENVDGTTWDKEFNSGYSNLENLLRVVRENDFAVFVWAPDDSTTIRGTNYESVRDNLIFEFGLFLGELGRERVFAVVPLKHHDLRLLSDLHGITLLYYDHERANKENIKSVELESVFRSACERIQDNINELGSRNHEPDYTIDSIIDKIRVLVDRSTLTRFVGKFPEFFSKEIIHCVSCASKSIRIATDHLAYGSFSSFEVYEQYIQKLVEQKRAGLDIKIVILDAPNRRQLIEEQFARNDEKWSDLKYDHNFKKLLVSLSSREEKAIISKSDFIDVLLQQEENGIKNFDDLTRECLVQVNKLLPIFLWIADNKEAIFSIPTYTNASTEYGFHTMDADLISSLLGVWNRYAV